MVPGSAIMALQLQLKSASSQVVMCAGLPAELDMDNDSLDGDVCCRRELAESDPGDGVVKGAWGGDGNKTDVVVQGLKMEISLLQERNFVLQNTLKTNQVQIKALEAQLDSYREIGFGCRAPALGTVGAPSSPPLSRTVAMLTAQAREKDQTIAGLHDKVAGLYTNVFLWYLEVTKRLAINHFLRVA